MAGRMNMKSNPTNVRKQLGRQTHDRCLKQQIKNKPIEPKHYNDVCGEDLPEVHLRKQDSANAGKRA